MSPFGMQQPIACDFNFIHFTADGEEKTTPYVTQKTTPPLFTTLFPTTARPDKTTKGFHFDFNVSSSITRT